MARDIGVRAARLKLADKMSPGRMLGLGLRCTRIKEKNLTDYPVQIA